VSAGKTHMCPVGACDNYGYEGDVCERRSSEYSSEPHGAMVSIPMPALFAESLLRRVVAAYEADEATQQSYWDELNAAIAEAKAFLSSEAKR
jgi:hypothetical protein